MKGNQHIEYKRNWRDEYLKWVCAFANADGGELLIGVEDNGEAVGIDNVSQLLEELPNKIASTMGLVCPVDAIERWQDCCAYRTWRSTFASCWMMMSRRHTASVEADG